MQEKSRRKNNPLCACGCGQRVKWNLYYECWNKYLQGHSNKFTSKNNPMKDPKIREKVSGKNNYKYDQKLVDFYEKIKNDGPPLCKCGCGKFIKWDDRRKIYSEFIHGHSTKFYNPMNSPEAMKKKIGENHYMKKPNYNSENNGFKQEKTRKINSKRMRENNPMFNPEIAMKVSLKTSGPNNWNWKGGITEHPYCDVWYEKEYRDDIFERDNYQCQNPNCNHNSDHCPLTRHHIDYDKLNCHPSNIITLCNSCNPKANYKRDSWKQFYRNIMSEKYGYKYD